MQGNISLRKTVPQDCSIIQELFPEEWHFDFHLFFALHGRESYFSGSTLCDDSTPIGFGNLLIFGPLAWIGNIVIHPAYRRKGLGRFVTQTLMEHGYRKGVKTFNLISTREGMHVYPKLGFKEVVPYLFFSPPANQKTEAASSLIMKAIKEQWKDIQALDQEVTGEHRSDFLQKYIEDAFVILDQHHHVQGFTIPSLGNGYAIAKNTFAGAELLRHKAVKRESIVIPETNSGAIEKIKQLGYSKCNALPRMICGESYNWQAENIFCRGTGFSG